MIQTIAITDIPFTGENIEVTSVNWNFDEAIIEIYSHSEKSELRVRFNNEFGLCALRLLDESDLSENWEIINMSGGWIYKVISGGWFGARVAERRILNATLITHIQRVLNCGS